jgi:ABC-type transport system involved in multi-copper enzyme maturation permease subunit
VSFLPIVQRELRAALRRRSTFRIRWWTALAAMLVSFFALAGVGVSNGGPSIGDPLFTILTVYAFGLCLLAGVLLTADCLSEEKREGTLGLLFLTDLKGYDVVLGKFTGRALNSFYALLALLPMVALPLLIGGVTGAEFWRMTLALLNTLFFSLATGIFVSALMRDGQRALGVTLALLVVLGGVLPLLAEITPKTRFSPYLTALADTSPFYPFYCARELLYTAMPGRFWLTLLASQMLGWVFLGMASWTLLWIWRERKERLNLRLPGVSRWRRLQSANSIRRSMLRARLLSKNPVLWLVSRERGLRWAAWTVTLAWGAVAFWLEPAQPLPGAWRLVLGWFGNQPYTQFGFLLKVLFAFQACRFFAEGRRSGLLELLLCTPLSNREILRGHTAALWRTFRAPLLGFVALLFAPLGFDTLAGAMAGDFDRAFSGLGILFLNLLYCVRLWLDLLAVCWFGMWQGLTMKNQSLAAVKTILFVLILPAPLCVLDWLASLFFFSWGSMRLQQDLRSFLAHQHQGPPMLAPVRPLRAPLAVPPIITQAR